MKENVSANWVRKRERLIVARVLEAGLEFTFSDVRKIVYEMSYSVQKEKHPEDCPCYGSKPCHSDVRDFNCFVCGCPNYDPNVRDKTGFTGGCVVSNRGGEYLPNPNPGKDGLGEKIWDCSDCSSYHLPLSSELFLIVRLEYYADLASRLKKERVQKGFVDFKSFADFLSRDVLGHKS
ncbi:Uncharacterised protein [uncultured archaeon]|nr:Uncharacterised protein [uncultured archaeon]